MNCIFCDIADRPKEFAIEPIAATDSPNYVLFADRTPGSDVHMLLTPVKHVGEFIHTVCESGELTSRDSEREILDAKRRQYA